jgi:hypothetical protein
MRQMLYLDSLRVAHAAVREGGGTVYDVDPGAKTIQIPVNIVEGKVLLEYGVPLPDLENGTTGRLVVPDKAVKNRQLADVMQARLRVKFLATGTELLFDVNADRTPRELRHHLFKTPNAIPRLRDTFVKALLNEDLLLFMRGTKRALLESCSCTVPSLGATLPSVNSAFTVITRQFEPGRTSSGGNVFLHAFYRESDSWIQLDLLRQQHEERLGRSIAFFSLTEATIQAAREEAGSSHHQQRTFPELTSDFIGHLGGIIGECETPFRNYVVGYSKEHRESITGTLSRLMGSSVGPASDAGDPLIKADKAELGAALWRLVGRGAAWRDGELTEAFRSFTERLLRVASTRADLHDRDISDVVHRGNEMLASLLTIADAQRADTRSANSAHVEPGSIGGTRGA